MAHALATRVLTGMPAIVSRSAELNAAQRRLGVPVSGRWQSQAIWFRHHPGFEPRAVLVERRSDVVAAAVVAAQRRRPGVWTVTAPRGPGDPFRLAADGEDAAKALAEGLHEAVSELHAPWSVYLPGLPARDPVVDHLRRLWPNSETRPGIPEPCLIFEPGHPLTTYLSRNTRNAVAKARNRIARDGIALRERCTRDPAEIRAALPDMFRLNRERNRQLRGRSPLDDARVARYLQDFLEEQVRLETLELLTVELDGEIAAFALCLDELGESRALTNVASPAWLRYSPGTICNAEVVRRAYEDPGCRGVNWGSGVQRYKLSGAATLRQRRNLVAWSSRAVRIAAQLKGRLATIRTHSDSTDEIDLRTHERLPLRPGNR